MPLFLVAMHLVWVSSFHLIFTGGEPLVTEVDPHRGAALRVVTVTRAPARGG